MEPKAAQSLIEKHRALSSDENKETDEYHEWYRGGFWSQVRGSDVSPTVSGSVAGSDDDDLNFQTNYTYAFLDSMIANICPQNPQVTINARDEDMHDFASARESLINDTMRRNALHDVLWDASTHAALSGRGVVRTVWSIDRRYPVCTAVDPRGFFYDTTVPFRFARYACEAVPITMDEFKRRTKRGSKFKYKKSVVEKVQATGYPEWLRPLKASLERTTDDAARDELEWVLIYEFYDFSGRNYWHFVDGIDEPIAEWNQLPYKYTDNPYSLLIFNKNLKSNIGISDIKLIADTLRRLNELDTLELRHAHKSIPKTVVNIALVDNFDDFATAVNSEDDLGIVQLRSQNPVPMNQLMGQTPVPMMPSTVDTMRERSMQNIEFVSGMSGYQRGRGGDSDVATELALMDTASRTRNGRRVRIMGDIMVDIAKKIGALWQQFLEEDRTLPVRVGMDSDKTIELTRVELGFDVSEDGKLMGENMWDESWYFDFEVVSFSPTENHRLVQLNKMQTMLPTITQMPFINQQKLVRKLLSLLGFEDIFDASAQPQTPPQPGQPGSQQGSLPQGGPQDSISTGAMPPGADVEDLSAVDARAMAQQPYGTG